MYAVFHPELQHGVGGKHRTTGAAGLTPPEAKKSFSICSQSGCPAPYQTVLLRLLHGRHGPGLCWGCWISGLIVITSRYDGRWGRLPFTPAGPLD